MRNRASSVVSALACIGAVLGLVALLDEVPPARSQETNAPAKSEEKGKAYSVGKSDIGKVPSGWKSAKTGQWEGSVWKVVSDETAPSGSGLTLAQTAKGPDGLFNLCVVEDSAFQDLELSVSLKSVSGNDDQGGGVVWRYRDPDNYYICRVNPLEENFRVYRVADGKRSQLATTKNNIEAPAGAWQTLMIRMQGNRIECSLNGKLLLEAKDDTFKEAGKIGLWTKADAETRFDKLTVRPLKAAPSTTKEVSWVGKKIMPKRVGVTLQSSADKERQAPVGTLRFADHVVMEQKDSRICVRQQGVDGWLDQQEVVLMPDAVAYFSGRVQSSPKDAVAIHARGLARLLSSDPDGALKDFDEAILLKPNERTFLVNRGLAYRFRKEFDKSIADFSAVIKLAPKEAEAYYQRGTTYRQKKHYAEAAADFNRSIEQDPKEPIGFNSAAWLMAVCPDERFRDGKRAVPLATKACELTHWKRAGYLDTLAAAFAEAGDFDSAVKYQLRALEDPGYESRHGAWARELVTLYMSQMPYREE